MPPSANSASLTRKLAQIWPYALPIIALSFAVAMHGFAAANPHSALREELAIIICAVVLLEMCIRDRSSRPYFKEERM